MVQNPDPDTPCMRCGHEWCRGDMHKNDMCWFYREVQLHVRGKYPRLKSSCHPAHVAIVTLMRTQVEGDDYDGFPFKDDYTDEELEQFGEEAFGIEYVD